MNRAIEVRLTARSLGNAAARRAQERQVERGFIHVTRIVELLRLYEADRDRFGTIADFYFPFHERFFDIVSSDQYQALTRDGD